MRTEEEEELKTHLSRLMGHQSLCPCHGGAYS
jgi:hypothetical protein